jgi:hypothetical protein
MRSLILIREMSFQTRFRIGLWLVCLLALGLRLYLLEDVSFHDDEARSQHLYIQQPAHHILTHYTPNNHWLSNILGYPMGQLGQPRFLLRWSSVFFGVLAVPLLALTGHQLFKNRWTGLMAASLLCLSAFHLQWSQQFRGYSPLLFFALLSFFWVYKALQMGSKRYWCGFLIATALAVISHLYGMLIFIVILIMVIVWSRDIKNPARLRLLFRSRDLSRPEPAINRSKSQQRWTLAVSLLALLFISYFIWFGKIYIIDVLHPPVKATPLQLIQYQWLAFRPTLSDISDFLGKLAMAFSAQPNQELALILFWGLAGIGLFLTARQGLRTALFLGIWLIVPVILVIIADLAIAGFFVFDRYLIFTLPAWLLLAAHTIVSSSQRLAGWLQSCLTSAWAGVVEYRGRGFSRPERTLNRSMCYKTGTRSMPVKKYKQAIFITLLITVLGSFGVLNFNVARLYFAERASHDWRAIAAYLAAHAAPTDLIICKQLPHRWPPRRLDWGDQCTKELKRRLADLRVTSRFPIKQLEIVASLTTGLRFRAEATAPGVIWLVMWGETVPQVTGAINDEQLLISSSRRQIRGLPAQLIPDPAIVAFDRLGHTALLRAGTKATLVDNLEETLEYLTSLDTTSPDRFDYYLRRAQLLAYQGRLEEAQLVLDQARELLTDNSRPLAEAEAAIETITANLTDAPSSAANKLKIDFGQPAAIRLTGYSLPLKLHSGQAILITISWQALAPVSADYTIFLHLRNPANQTVAQLDFRPFDGAYPTYQWPTNTRIEETRLWTVPRNLAPGAYVLRLGLYQVEGLAHLPAPGDATGKEGVLLSHVWVE